MHINSVVCYSSVFAGRVRKPKEAKPEFKKEPLPVPDELDSKSFILYARSGANEEELNNFIDEVLKRDQDAAQNAAANGRKCYCVDRNKKFFLIDIYGSRIKGKTFVKALDNHLPSSVILRLLRLTKEIYADISPDLVGDIVTEHNTKQALKLAGIYEQAREIAFS